MVGENIQRAREQIQSVRGQFNLINKLTSSNPGILTNFPMGKRISERVQSIRGMGFMAPKNSPGVYKEPPSVSSQKFVSV